MDKGAMYFRIRQCIWLLLAFIICTPTTTTAQCSNWSISSQVITASSCAGNGSYGVTISGPDAINITNKQYGIPLAASGFSVPLNNSATFSNIPPGTYQVSVVGLCNGNYVGKTSSVTIPGNYTPPSLSVSLGRNSLACGAFGKLNFGINGGKAPYSLHIVSAPAAYIGATTFSFSTSSFGLGQLPSGLYVVQATDYCNNGTVQQFVSIADDDVSSLRPNLYNVQNIGCDTLVVTKPDLYNTAWQAYQGDTLFKVSAQVGNVSLATPYENFDGQPFTIKLLPGKTLKDCYGQVVTFSVKSPCGTILQFFQLVPAPTVAVSTDQNCNSDFKALISFGPLLCYPVTSTLKNVDDGSIYGPYTSGASFQATGLPIGNYTITYTTGDGYAGTGQLSTSDITSNPYHVTAVNLATGLNNYISEFDFYTSVSSSSARTVELFSGPAGYSYTDNSWTLSNLYVVVENQTAVGYGKLVFPAGNYVWKITDACGIYYLPVTVGPQDLYQYTISLGHTRQSCEGMWVYPTGTATNNGRVKPFKYEAIEYGHNWSGAGLYNAGDSFLVNTGGTYTIIATSAGPAQSVDTTYNTLPYPNTYTVSYTFTYTYSPVTVDLNNSQGILCRGSGPGQGIINVKGQNGTPFTAPLHYNYYLALQGNGASGPYLTSNTTGVFTNFGGNANDIFDIKVEDSCGAFAVQPLKILDLQQTRLISSTNYTPCAGGTVQLAAVALPGGTYSWTGPGGFTSSIRNPIISNIGPQNTGVYHVTITTPQCGQPVTDSTIVTTNANPPKPLVSLDCSRKPVTLTIVNPVAGYSYQWYLSFYEYGDGGGFLVQSDSGYTEHIYGGADYRAVAKDTSTGCITYGDSLFFGYNTFIPLNATVYSPHLSICPGDSTILVAQSRADIATYQWFFNNVAIPDATGVNYITRQPGSYKVVVKSGPCGADTSASVMVSNIPLPVASISAPIRELCAGDTAHLLANTGSGYTYSWLYNDSTVPGNASPMLSAGKTGDYKVIVSNGGCIAISPSVAITVDPKVVVQLLPASGQTICTGDTVHFTTMANPNYTYTWQRNGTVVPGAATNAYDATITGNFSVTVKSGVCPIITSPTIPVTVLVRPVVSITAPKQEICIGDTAFLYANTDPSYTYTWSLNNVTLPGGTLAAFGATQQGAYRVSISNGGCTASSPPISITVDPAPVVDLQPGTDQLLCTGDVVQFTTTANAAYNYTWIRNGAAIPGATGNAYRTGITGTYQVSVQAGACPIAISQPVTVSLLPTSVALGADTVVCTDGPFAIPLSAGNGFTDVLWSTGATTQSIVVTRAGTYQVRATNQCGVFVDSIHVYTPASYAITLPADTLICNRANSAVFSVTPLLQHVLWSTGSTASFVTIVRPGLYWVQGLSACGTLITDTMNVRFCAPEISSIELSSDSICTGDCIHISATTDNYPQQFSWSFTGAIPDSSDAPDPGTICYSKVGVYPVQLTVKNAGGTSTRTSQVVVLSKPVPRFADTTISVPYKSGITLSPCAEAQYISWYLDDSLLCANCHDLTIDAKYYYNVYHCIVSNGSCADSCFYKLQVVDIPHDLWLPDAFTPNGDGKNDIFRIITDNPNVQVINLEVYNRWGQLLFISRLGNEGWDGTFHGVPADIGTYSWLIRYRILGAGDAIYFKKGSVEVIR